MATISSSQKLANTQPPTLSATQESSAEGEGLFASLFGGVVLEDASETKSADMAGEASWPASGDGDAEREDVAVDHENEGSVNHLLNVVRRFAVVHVVAVNEGVPVDLPPHFEVHNHHQEQIR